MKLDVLVATAFLAAGITVKNREVLFTICFILLILLGEDHCLLDSG